MTDARGSDNPNDVRVVGVDGWRGGWVAAALTGAGLRWSSHATFAELAGRFPAARIGVDMPIGLPIEGYRDSDLEARTFLGRARSSIFFTPTRAVVGRWSPGAPHPLGIGVSRQTWNLLPRIVELDDLLSALPALAERVREVHPECSFRALAPSTDFESKKTARGVGQRLNALRAWRDLPDLAQAPTAVPVDDVVDAAVVAWTTERWCEHPDRLIRFGSAQRDERGRRMSIVA